MRVTVTFGAVLLLLACNDSPPEALGIAASHEPEDSVDASTAGDSQRTAQTGLDAAVPSSRGGATSVDGASAGFAGVSDANAASVDSGVGGDPTVPRGDVGLSGEAGTEPSDSGIVASVGGFADAGDMPNADALGPCEDYECDATVVRQILDLNGLEAIEVREATANGAGDRVVSFRLTTNLDFAERDGEVSVLPALVSRLSALQELAVSDGSLSTLPDELAELEHLRALTVARVPLYAFPEVVLQLRNLVELTLQEVGLTVVPRELASLTKLQQLRLSGNSLVQLPDELTTLTDLVGLSLSSNSLTSLPLDIDALTNLEQLSVAANDLSELPARIVTLSPSSLTVRNNHLCRVTTAVGDWLDVHTSLDWDHTQSDSASGIRCDVVRGP